MRGAVLHFAICIRMYFLHANVVSVKHEDSDDDAIHPLAGRQTCKEMK